MVLGSLVPEVPLRAYALFEIGRHKGDTGLIGHNPSIEDFLGFDPSFGVDEPYLGCVVFAVTSILWWLLKVLRLEAMEGYNKGVDVIRGSIGIR